MRARRGALRRTEFVCGARLSIDRLVAAESPDVTARCMPRCLRACGVGAAEDHPVARPQPGQRVRVNDVTAVRLPVRERNGREQDDIAAGRCDSTRMLTCVPCGD